MGTLAANDDTYGANLYVFLTDSPNQSLYGLVPKIGSVCDASKYQSLSMTRYTDLNNDGFGEPETGEV